MTGLITMTSVLERIQPMPTVDAGAQAPRTFALEASRLYRLATMASISAVEGSYGVDTKTLW